MGKIMEAIFCILYLFVTFVLGIMIIRKGSKSKEYKLFGAMTLVLVCGDAFHLVPRILSAMNPNGDYHISLGYGKMVTSITMTIFYLILYFVFSIRYKYNNRRLMLIMIVLSVIRIALCFMPQNDWAGEDPLIWGIYRNIPFVIMGIIMIILFFGKRSDFVYKWMWLAISLSFAFYLPVVLWSDVSPMIGMLMLPKTCMYVWAVFMGYKSIR